MAAKAAAGATYLIDRRDGKPAHLWIVLTDPDPAGSFMAVSFTDRNNFSANPDVWDAGTNITDLFSLSKDSVLQLRWIAVKSQHWLDDRDAVYFGQCVPDVLDRARCNLCWFPEHIQPSVWPEFAAHRPDWEDRC